MKKIKKQIKACFTILFWICAINVILIACNDSTTTFPSTSDEQTNQRTQSEKIYNLPAVAVFKAPTCGCCTHWEDHLKMNGFKVVSRKEKNMHTIKAKYGVRAQLASCHTAIVDGYIIEGHVPANDIKRLLKERPAIVGLTAPGMPQKSPGMQGHGLKPDGYDVLAFKKSGQTRIYSSY